MRVLITIAVVAAVLCATAAIILFHPAFGRRPTKQTKAKIEASPNYRDGRFHNILPTPQFTGETNFFAAMWGFLTAGDTNKTPVQPVHAIKTDLHSLSREDDWLVWFGHSSYLFQIGGKRFLVDPLLKPEFPVTMMLRPFAGTDIYRPNDIPAIDYLIITHEHWDHLDYATLRDLRGKVRYAVCPLGIADYLEYWGYSPDRITEMDWQDVYKQDENKDSLVITCLPTRHFSNRLFRSNQTLWASFMIEYNGRKIYVGGDGGYDNRFKDIHKRFGEIDLAFLENGQYNKDWAYIHTMPSDLENAISDLNAKNIFTVHHDKFALARHAWTEPDSVAHDIAARKHISLLDAPIGTVVKF
ncbi:MAG: MBL fold metallo-hydrolase [Paludibacteraceae bacterium]|nr:MBL fold metallo-hydrolase [Paludibacteraceae bacterium]